MSKNNAQYVWYNSGDTSRNPVAAFRRTFNLTKPPEKAEICLFADTVYTLHVNGNFVGFGPVRFDPRFPQYDTYDIAPYLREGKNVVAVLANFHGHKVFKSIPAQAAFIAWGQVETGGEAIDIATGQPGWKCKQHTAHCRFTPKLSFALNAQIHYEQGAFDENWASLDYNDTDWPAAVTLSNQAAFGVPTPREIEFMELTDVVPAAVTIRPLLKTEELYSFSFAPPIGYDTAYDQQQGYSRFICWATYVYSPRAQKVTAGVLYERLWVNGVACTNALDPVRQLRYNYVLSLNEGWNYIFGQVDLHQDIYDGYLALPNDRGLVLSADKDEKVGKLFRYIPMQPAELGEEQKKIPLPFPEDIDVSKFGGWVYTTNADRAQSPCREASWDLYDAPVQNVSPTDLAGFVVQKDLYPHGFTLTIDMDHMRLVFPLLKMSGGLNGAAIDLLYSDRLADDGAHLRSLSWVPLGDRLVCGSSIPSTQVDSNAFSIDFMPIQPRGFRYIGITVRGTTGDVKLDDIRFLSAHYPVQKIGSFECSDPLLNKIWEAGALTQYLNMEDTYTDCVDRERGLYALDLLVQYHVNLVCYGDQPLMKRALEIYGQSGHECGLFRCLYPNEGDYILTDFCLYIVNSFYAYYRHTNDTALVAKYWPEILKNMQVFHRLSDERADKLMNGDPPAGNWPREFVDSRTGYLGDGGRMDNTGINCMYSCLYLMTLREMLQMAQAVSPSDVQDLQMRISVLEKSIPTTFWSAEKGLFADNTKFETFSPHSSVYTVLAGVATPQQREELRKNVPSLFAPFFKNGLEPSGGEVFETSHGYYLFRGLYELGLPEVVERCIKEGWGYFLSQGLKTTSEHFNIGNSQCHAWTAHPTYMLSRYVLGVEFDAFGEVKLNPRPGSLAWAKGTVPHPNGRVEVEWRVVDGEVVVDRFEV